jgi:hypothetical protein
MQVTYARYRYSSTPHPVNPLNSFNEYNLLEATSSSRRSRSAPRYGNLRPLATFLPLLPFLCHRASHVVRLVALLKRPMAQCAEVGLIVGQAVRRQRLHGHLGLEIWFARSSEILSHHRYPESSVRQHFRGCILR